jgi:glycosyltransferase involved in cell wall biosynthesis
VIGQTIRDWELILVDDCGHKLEPLLKRYPFIKLYATQKANGAGAARNLGIDHARGQFVFFLDADDWLAPDALDFLLQVHVSTGHYAFSDFYTVGKNGTEAQKSYPYDRDLFLKKQIMHSVTALVPTAWAREVGGFDPSLPGWEEYDFYMKLAVRGYCGVCVKEPLFYYRLDTGTRRKVSHAKAKELNAGFAKKFGGAEMSGCCGSAGNAILEAKRAIGLIPRDTTTIADLPNEVRLEFTGNTMGPAVWRVNGRDYHGAADGIHRFINAPREDVEGLTRSGKWRIIPPPPEARGMSENRPEIVAQPAPVPALRRGG